MTSSTYQAEVAARTEQILHAAHECGSDRSLWGAHALMPHRPAAAEIVEIVRNHLWRKTDSPASGLLGGPFEILPCMLLLCRWEHELPTEATALIRDFMTQAHLERGNTENHWLMAYGGMLLAAERWPDADFAWGVDCAPRLSQRKPRAGYRVSSNAAPCRGITNTIRRAITSSI